MRRAVERERRNDGVDAGTVGQAGVHHRRRFVHAAAHARNDAVDDLKQVPVVAERCIRAGQQAAFLNEHMVLVVDHDVGDLLIFEQRLERPETEYFIEQIGLDLFLLIET